MDLKNISYLSYTKNNKIYYIIFDYVSDTSSDISSDITDAPIDARGGASLQDKRSIGMNNVGLTVKFSNRVRYTIDGLENDNLLFNTNTENRLQMIANFFEIACDNALIFEVCKKGVIYKNQLLNNVSITFDESVSSLKLSLSFIEVLIIGAKTKVSTTIVNKINIPKIIEVNPNKITLVDTISDDALVSNNLKNNYIKIVKNL